MFCVIILNKCVLAEATSRGISCLVAQAQDRSCACEVEDVCASSNGGTYGRFSSQRRYICDRLFGMSQWNTTVSTEGVYPALY